jgi:hypothetical protein
MAFTHTCNASGLWSEDALDVLAKFPMVNTERFMGQHKACFAKHRNQWGPPGGWLNQTHGNPTCPTAASGSVHLPGCNCTTEEAPVGLTTDADGTFVEDHTLAAMKQLKARNPNISTIFYHDSARMWTNDQVDAWGRTPKQAVRYWNPTVYRVDDAIVEQHPEWTLKNRSGGFVWDNYANNHIYNFVEPDVQRLWAEVCINATLSGAADGCFADDASIGFDAHGIGHAGWMDIVREWNTTNETAQAWVKGHQNALTMLNAALGNGTLIANGGVNPNANGFMMETAMPGSMIPTIQASVKAGLVNQVHTNMYDAGANPDVRDALAAFLIATGPLTYFSGPYGWQISQTWSDPLGIADVRRRWLPEFDKPLGEAISEGVYNNITHIYAREFASGTNVTFNTTSNRGKIVWANDRSVTQGPGCIGKSCVQCQPPLYEKGSARAGTGGCNCAAKDCGGYLACKCAEPLFSALT